MTPEELKRLRELEAAATSGPWVGDEFEMLAPQAPTIMRGNKRIVWADDYHMNEWDAEFIAAARNHFKELLDEVERLQSEFRSAKNVGCDATCLNYRDHEEMVHERDRALRRVEKLEKTLNSIRDLVSNTPNEIYHELASMVGVRILDALAADDKESGG